MSTINLNVDQQLLFSLLNPKESIYSPPSYISVMTHLSIVQEQKRQFEHTIEKLMNTIKHYETIIQSVSPSTNSGNGEQASQDQTERLSESDKDATSCKQESGLSSAFLSNEEPIALKFEFSEPKSFKSLPCHIKDENKTISEEEEEDSESEDKSPKIKRRNGFKQNKGNVDSKDRPRSKAKHLWVAFGRKITEYAIKNTEGEIREKIKHVDLSSKGAYTYNLKIKKNDTQEEIQFKYTFGTKAIEFLNNEDEMENVFASSEYRDELVAQKHKVTKWIAGLINSVDRRI